MLSCWANDCSFKYIIIAILTLSYVSQNIQVLLGVYVLLSYWIELSKEEAEKMW